MLSTFPRSRNTLLLVLPPIAICLFAISYFFIGSQPAVERTPQLQSPSELDLGDQFFGETALGRFEISNAGTSPLMLDDFHTSCSCAGIEIERGGETMRVQDLTVLPGETVPLFARISVSADVGFPQIVTVGCRTNDPKSSRFEMRISIPRVLGGVFCSPQAVNFGNLKPSERIARRVVFYENGIAGRKLDRVSADTGRFKAKLVSLTEEEIATGHPTGGKAFAALEIVPDTLQSGSLAGELTVETSEAPPKTRSLTVSGKVDSLVKAAPVFFSFVGSSDKTEESVAISSASASGVVPTIKSISPGFSGRLASVSNNKWQLFVSPGEKARPGEIVLEIRDGESIENLAIPIFFRMESK